MACAVLRVQRRVFGDLLTQVGRRVEQRPALAVRADRDRGLGPGPGTPIADARRLAHPAITVPLRKPAAGSRTQNEDSHNSRTLAPGKLPRDALRYFFSSAHA